MKEIIVHSGLRTELVDSPIPRPEPNQIVIKVEVSGSNPKDCILGWVTPPLNNGDDIAGTVYEVGRGVIGFKPGDRVFAFHEIGRAHGSWAEYAVAPEHTTALLPPSVTFEEAATIPLAAMTAAEGLFRTLALPGPWAPATTSTPLLVYGGSSAVGAFGIKLAKLANVHPIIAVAGAGCDYVSSLLDSSQGDAVFDYREGPQKLEEMLRSHLAGISPGTTSISYAFAAITNADTVKLCFSVLDADGTLAHVLPLSENIQVPEAVSARLVMVGDVHGQFGDRPGYKDFGYITMKLLTRWLESGELNGHPHEVIPGGLSAVSEVLAKLIERKASAVKYVFRIADTPAS